MDKTKQSFNTLVDRVKPSNVIIITENEKGQKTLGTGFVVKYKKKKFVFSCHHILEDFLNAPKSAVYLNYDIEKIITKHDIVSSGLTDSKIDIGYLALKDDYDLSDLICCLYPDDFCIGDIDWSQSGALIYGYPGKLVDIDIDKNLYTITGFAVGGTYIGKDGNNGYETFEYPEEKDVSDSGLSKIPPPNGMSGSSIWCFDTIADRPTDFTKARIVCIGHTWNYAKRVYYGTLISDVFKLIDAKEGM